MWHVVQDPSSNQFFRLNEPAYHFVALLDGQRSVDEVWDICNDQLGDAAPTQGEAIQLLGQLYTANLLQCELPPDAEGLFNRYHKRVSREVKGYLSNLLFIRIPLFDPDVFLDRWVGVFGKIFSGYGFALLLVLVSIGGYFAIQNAGSFADQASNILEPDKLPLLFLSFWFVKIFHEFGHAFCCKKFGKDAGAGGEVHTMGIMLLVFTPLPYVDASSAWALRGKWHRVLVGGGGMLVELGIASIAAVVWANTNPGAAVNVIAYNIMFIASVSTLLFNGNPLLRYDAYYILSDVVEIPNLSQRAKQYIYYLVKKFVYGVENPTSPAQNRGERIWFVFYGIASTVYRVFICVAILLFVADKLFFIGAVLAIAAAVVWVLVPFGKFLHYLAASNELMRVRPRAIWITVGFFLSLVIGFGLVPSPDRFKVEGVINPLDEAMVHASVDGFVEDVLPSGKMVSPDDEPLAIFTNRELTAQQEQLNARRRKIVVQVRQGQTKDIAEAQALKKQIEAIDEQIARVNEQIQSLNLKAPIAGTWVSSDYYKLRGVYVKRGQKLGQVASLDKLIVRATVGQEIAAPLIGLARQKVEIPLEIRVKGRPDMEVTGEIIKPIRPAGQKELPSPALGFAAGGSVRTATDDRQGTEAAERFFEIRIRPQEEPNVKLLSGQRVIVRFELPSKPLVVQWWRSLLQLIQRRFHV